MKRWAAALLVAAVAACTPEPEADLDGPALEILYAQTSLAIQAGGGLRSDRVAKDAPLSIPRLAENFEQIAFYSEFSRDDRGRARGQQSIGLTRWSRPVRVGVIFGDSVADDQRAADLEEIEELLALYRRLTGLEIFFGGVEDPNFLILVLDRAEQRDLATSLAGRGRFLSAIAQDLANSPPSLLCSASIFGPSENPGDIEIAVALIKAEHRGLMRRSCFHEELTQAMGLLNDSDAARPSIFNDDEEFALLTFHDEILLRMLYDPRLSVGTRAEDARPLLPQIASDAAKANGARLR